MYGCGYPGYGYGNGYGEGSWFWIIIVIIIIFFILFWNNGSCNNCNNNSCRWVSFLTLFLYIFFLFVNNSTGG